ncbi:MAG: acyl-CoA dehydrogenase family protein [Thermomicrobiales bacterium]
MGGFRISGRKMFCSQAPVADVLVTMAVHDDPEDGSAVLLVGMQTASPGVSMVETWDALGMRGTGSHDMQLDDVNVAAAQIVARRPWGQVDPALRSAGIHFAPPVAAVYFGVAAAARDEAVRVVGTRRNGSGEALAEDKTTQRLIGLMEQKLKVAWWSLTGALTELGEDYGPDEAVLELVMLAKRQVVTEAIEVVGLAMEAVGGAAYFKRSPLERAYRDVRAGMFHPITPEKTLLLAGARALGQPADGIW